MKLLKVGGDLLFQKIVKTVIVNIGRRLKVDSSSSELRHEANFLFVIVVQLVSTLVDRDVQVLRVGSDTIFEKD